MDNSDTPPVMEKNTILAPVRTVVHWDGETRSIIILKSGKKIVLQVNSFNVRVNNAIEYINVSPQIINDRTMVPVRFICETLGTQVNWENATHTVKITSTIDNDILGDTDSDVQVNTKAHEKLEEK